MHTHLEGPSGLIAGGVRGNFQFLPRVRAGPQEGHGGAAHTDLSFLSEAAHISTDPGVPHTAPGPCSPRARLTSHHGAVLEVSGQLSILTGQNRASHAEHDT